MVAVINVDACPFLVFSDLVCHLENAGIGVFFFVFSFLVPPDKEAELESSNQETSQSAGKNTGVVLVPCCVPAAVSSGVDISEISGCQLLRQIKFSVTVTKFTSTIGVS